MTCRRSERPRPPCSLGQPTQVQPWAPRWRSHASRSSNRACSSPGPPRPRTTAKSRRRLSSRKLRTSSRKARSSALSLRSTPRRYLTDRQKSTRAPGETVGDVDPPDAGAGEDATAVEGTSHLTVWRQGDHALLAEGTFASPAEHEELLGSLVVDAPDVWASSLPPD